jgi:hypothetical protein
MQPGKLCKLVAGWRGGGVFRSQDVNSRQAWWRIRRTQGAEWRLGSRVTSFHTNEDVQYGSWEEATPAGYGQEAGVRMCGCKEADEATLLSLWYCTQALRGRLWRVKG